MYPSASALRSLITASTSSQFLTADDLSPQLFYKLLTEKDFGFSDYLDCSTALSDRICKYLSSFTGYTDFCTLLKSREFTYTRISRTLLHILLNQKTPVSFKPSFSERHLKTPYVRLLGFRKDSDAAEKVNEAMQALIEDGTLNTLAEKYDLAELLLANQ